MHRCMNGPLEVSSVSVSFTAGLPTDPLLTPAVRKADSCHYRMRKTVSFPKGFQSAAQADEQILFSTDLEHLGGQALGGDIQARIWHQAKVSLREL